MCGVYACAYVCARAYVCACACVYNLIIYNLIVNYFNLKECKVLYKQIQKYSINKSVNLLI